MTLTKAEINAIKKILDKKTLRGRKRLEDWLWTNTTDPKYKVGDCFEVTDTSRRIYGVRVVKFHAKVVDIRWLMQDRVITYTLEGVVKNGDKDYTTNFYARENELRVKVKDNVTVINVSKTAPEDMIDIF